MFSAAKTSLLRQARAAVRPACVQQSSLARLLSTLAVLETRDGKLNVGSLAAVTAGQKLGGSVTGFLAGSNIKAVAAEAAKVDGLEKVIYIENEAYSKGLPENYAPLLAENIKKGGFTHVVSGHSSFGKSLMPRLAAMLDVQQISDITSVDSEDSKWSSSHTVATWYDRAAADTDHYQHSHDQSTQATQCSPSNQPTLPKSSQSAPQPLPQAKHDPTARPSKKELTRNPHVPQNGSRPTSPNPTDQSSPQPQQSCPADGA